MQYIITARATVGDLRTELDHTQDYFLIELSQQSIATLQAVLTVIQMALVSIEAAALNLSRPLTPQQSDLLQTAASNYNDTQVRFFRAVPDAHGETCLRTETTSAKASTMWTR